MVLLFLPSDEKKDYFGCILLWSWVFYVTIVDCSFIRFCLVVFWYKYISFGIIWSGDGMYLFAFVMTAMANMCFVVVSTNKSPHYQINQRTNHTYQGLLSILSSKCFVSHLFRFGFQSVLLIRFSRYCLHWSQVVENANQPNVQVNPSQVPFDGAYTKDSLYNRFQAIRKHSTCKNKWENRKEKNIAEDKTHHSMNNEGKSDEVLVMGNKVGITRF